MRVVQLLPELNEGGVERGVVELNREFVKKGITSFVISLGGKLENRLRYSVQLCYNTFPFPKITEAKRMEIEQAAEAVLIAREMHTEKTLAQMYDPERMPANLREAHTHLDRVVESCYRPAPFTSDEERLEHLFALYERMTKK